MEIKEKILIVGEKNINGYEYTNEMMNSILKTFKNREYIFGKIGSIGKRGGMPVQEITHRVEDLWVENEKELWAKFSVIDTPMGEKFKEWYNENEVVFRPEGSSKVDNGTKQIFDYKIIGINAFKKSETTNLN